MNSKVVWLTSITVWLWLVPAVQSAYGQGEAPEALGVDLSEQAPLASQTSLPSADLPSTNSPSAVDLLPIQPIAAKLTAPKPPTPESPALESLALEPLVIEPLPATSRAVTSALADPVQTDPVQTAPVQQDASNPSGNPSGEPVPDSSLPFTDPMEEWSTAAWLDLISDQAQPVTNPAATNPADPEFDSVAALSQPQPLVSQPLTQAGIPALISPILTLPEPTLKTADLPVAQISEFESSEFESSEFESADPLAQVTSVSQLADVQPTDWAYQALQSLVERYGTIVGYPDGTFKGERALTRYEFAAGVNAAMDRITDLIATSSAATVTEADLDILNRLQADFATELISLRGRLDGLEARIAEVSANQFSTTVVLSGQTTFGLADAWGGDPPGLGETNPVFAYLAQLQLSGSFSKRDAFKLDFDAGNFAGGGFAEPQALNTQMALMGFQTDTDNRLELSGAEYRFAVGDRLVLTFKPVGFGLDSVLSPNSIFASSTQGALSRFAAETPIFRMGSLDAGLGLDLLMTDRTRLQIAYGARDASDPDEGLFASDHRAFGVQLLARPFRTVTTGFAYVNAFAGDGFLDTFTGSTNADTSGGFAEPAAIHALSGTLQWQIVPSVILAAWGGAAVTDSLSSDAVALSSTYQFSLGFPDMFGREGDLLGVMVGQPFRLRYGLLIEREDEGSGLHYEVFYRIRVNDNIAVTPGVFVVTDPGHIPGNNTIVVGAIRTAFSF